MRHRQLQLNRCACTAQDTNRARQPALTPASSRPWLRFRLLCPASLYDSGAGEWSVDVCNTCKSSLDNARSTSPPKNSIANGNFRGRASAVPELSGLPEAVSCGRLRGQAQAWVHVCGHTHGHGSRCGCRLHVSLRCRSTPHCACVTIYIYDLIVCIKNSRINVNSR